MAAGSSRRIIPEAVEVIEHPLMPRPVPEPRDWGDCPLDILLLVFEWLQPADLMSCIYVNCYWRDAVNYMGVHLGIWKQLAQAGMVNKGIDLRRRMNPQLSWRDLYINYRLWHSLQHATISWAHELVHKDIRYLHVYKDILILESDKDYDKKYYHISKHLLDGSKRLIHIEQLDADVAIKEEENRIENLENVDVVKQNGAHIASFKENYMSDKMIKKLVEEPPFTRLLVIDEECYYVLNQENVLYYSKWDETNQDWTSFVLARYYMCNKSICDINVYNDDVYMLVKTGLVFKLDRTGRNFRPDFRFNAYLTPAQYEVSRMIYGHLDSSIQREGQFDLPDYGTGMKVMFHKVSVVVAVPCDKEFKMNVDEKTGHIVIEYPGLTCATQHGDVLLLGFVDGKVEICIPQKLSENGGKSEVSCNVKDCPEYPADTDPAIVAIEVHEDRNSHTLFVATQSCICTLTVTHPRNSFGLDKDFFTCDL